MNSPGTCTDVRLALGVYVVGAIEPAERAIVEAHLTHCADCREELAQLAGLPALLGRVPAADVERLAAAAPPDQAEPSADLLPALLGRVVARRKVQRWRRLTAVAAAAVIAVGIGLGAGILAARGGQPASRGGSDVVAGSAAGVHLTVSYAPAKWGNRWGTSMNVLVTGVQNGTRCKFWVITKAGRWVQAGQWTVLRGHEGVIYPAASAVAEAQVHGFAVTAGNATLVRVLAS